MMEQRPLHSRISEKVQDTHSEYYSWDGMPFIMKKFETAAPAANLKMKQREFIGLSTSSAILTYQSQRKNAVASKGRAYVD